MAIASLVCGIVSVIGGFFLIIPPILAVVFGHQARSHCNKYYIQAGMGMSLAGMIMGYVSIVLVSILGFLAVPAVPAFLKVRANSEDKAVLNNARQLSAGADQYYLENGVTFVSIGSLIGPSRYVTSLTVIAGETYPTNFTVGQTITVTGIAGQRTITYAP